MNSELGKNVQNDFEKYFFKLLNNTVFGKAMENVREHRDIKSAKTEVRRNYLVSQPNYQIAKYFGMITWNLNKVNTQNYIKTKEDIAEDVETRFDTSNYELEWPLPRGKNQKNLD